MIGYRKESPIQNMNASVLIQQKLFYGTRKYDIM